MMGMAISPMEGQMAGSEGGGSGSSADGGESESQEVGNEVWSYWK